jgi:hypothetical protein
MNAIGSPTQKMWVTIATTVLKMEREAPWKRERGITTQYITR